jgi:tetratricopeptide (TPR) repeat protein
MTLAIRFGRIGYYLGAAACAISLTACSTPPQAPVADKPAKPSMESLLAKAGQASGAGQKEQAVKLWKEAAAAYPAGKTPWANIAQARYDAGQYGEAITSAQEVLVRDPNDRLANSIIAISGLRLSTRALADLSRQNNLSGSIRTESQDLAKLLRESLGEQVLVPPPVQAAAPQKASGGKGRKARAKSDEGSGANPFGALK